MTKKRIIILISFVLYAVVLFTIATEFSVLIKADTLSFAEGISYALRLLPSFILVCLIGNTAFVFLVIAIERKFTFFGGIHMLGVSFIICTFLMLFWNFFFWITQLANAISINHQIAIVATTSALVTLYQREILRSKGKVERETRTT